MLSSDKTKSLAHLPSYSGGFDFGSWRANVVLHATSKEQWHHLAYKTPLGATPEHLAACEATAATQRTTAMLQHPFINPAGVTIDNPTAAQLKAHQEPIMQLWQDKLHDFLESKLTGEALTLVQNISRTDPLRGTKALARLDAVYGHYAARDDNTAQEALLKNALVDLHSLMITASTTWGISPLIAALEAHFLAATALGTTGAIHDTTTLLIAKMILEQCPDTRHTTAFPTTTFDKLYTTVADLLRAMRQHARRAPDRPMLRAPDRPSIHGAALATIAVSPPPTSTRHASTKTYSRPGVEECKKCGFKTDNISLHLYTEHYKMLQPSTQERLTTKHGNSATSTPTILAITTPDAPPLCHGSSGGDYHTTYEAYEAAGLPSFLWDGRIVNINYIT
jgi:hypothetical protein|mmetsp:Transcript_54171/g.128679  ORF Transcript_54171/g.128679 Transcript_54171/m.128679 type:complete len:394 (-) Transcript_54171:1543-2724(-)